MKNRVKNIIFDLGGVLLNIDYQAPIREFAKLGIPDFHALYSKANQSALFDDFEMGKISPAEFRNNIRQISKVDLSDLQIDHAWNSILLDFPEQNTQMLNELKGKYRLFLLSNTNEIHIHSFEASLKAQFKVNFFEQVFEKVYYSSRIGYRKPNANAFEFVLKSNDLSPHETVFIDDSIQHVKGAKELGIDAHWLDLQSSNTVDLVKTKLGL